MITMLMDLENQNWVCEVDDASHDSVKVMIYYLTSPNVKIVKNFHFSYYLRSAEVSTEDVIIKEIQRGIDPNELLDIDNPYLKILVAVVEYSNLRPETSYYFDLIASNRRKPFEGRCDFSTKISPAPYDSWIWNTSTKEWEPPVTKPDPVWDEESASWIIP